MDNENTGREYKSFKFELKEANEEGEFSGYAAVFGNKDDGDDIIEKGAFARTILEDFSRIKILSQHRGHDLPIGKPLELKEDDHGLYIRGKISDTQTGRDIRTLLKDGVLTEMSIGYDTVKYDFDSITGIRHLKEIRLWEVSIVTWAMNNQAKIDAVKSLQSGTEELKTLVDEIASEAKAGKLTRTKLEAIKPFIAVMRELTDILDPLLNDSQQSQEDQSAEGTKSSGIVFEIVP